MQYSRLFSLIERNADGAQVNVPAEWKQGRAIFGGLQGALALDVMRQRLGRTIPLKSFQMTFVAPLQGEVMQMRADILREGKNVTHVQASLLEDGQVLAVATGVFGVGRPSVVARLPEWNDIPEGPVIESRYIPGVTPTFLQHFKARWLKGNLPISGALSPQASVMAELLDEGTCTEAHVMAFADFMPPMALSAFATPAPGSSMTWMVEMLRDDVAELPLSGWRLDADLQAAVDGYTSQSCVIWGPDRRPVALSRQTMVVFG